MDKFCGYPLCQSGDAPDEHGVLGPFHDGICSVFTPSEFLVEDDTKELVCGRGGYYGSPDHHWRSLSGSV